MRDTLAERRASYGDSVLNCFAAGGTGIADLRSFKVTGNH